MKHEMNHKKKKRKNFKTDFWTTAVVCVPHKMYKRKRIQTAFPLQDRNLPSETGVGTLKRQRGAALQLYLQHIKSDPNFLKEADCSPRAPYPCLFLPSPPCITSASCFPLSRRQSGGHRHSVCAGIHSGRC